jgi:hypothetical protein
VVVVVEAAIVELVVGGIDVWMGVEVVEFVTKGIVVVVVVFVVVVLEQPDIVNKTTTNITEIIGNNNLFI